MNRVERLREQMAGDEDAFLIMQPENRRYLTGFTGSAGFLLVSREQCLLATDFRYWEQARRQSPDWELVPQQGSWVTCLREIVAARGWNRIALEADFITVHQQQALTAALPQVEWVPVTGRVEKLRVVKAPEELAAISRAVALADVGFQYILDAIRPGVTEREVALELEFFLRRLGSEGIPFEFIVASGHRAALPHGQASEKVLAQGDFLILDFGCIKGGYCSDMTRTVMVGQPTPEQREIYAVVRAAQEAALAVLAPGKSGGEVDQVAREVIKQAGYGEYFGHGLGHGVGLAVHEDPRLAPGENDLLAPGQVVTVEPGIYLPGRGGVRIEDLVIITKDGCRVLTGAPKELLVL
ncbi:MAG: Xaa-Pro peptidase family protein [Heliobacteriaceae bacterium]|nr:Xaa-Pro peptidase family protein [Heliobacteriaceae bacterium]MDD4587196.1 Xaa-Pro peptidase family protein [Heliobacteriaceae bacterium]